MGMFDPMTHGPGGMGQPGGGGAAGGGASGPGGHHPQHPHHAHHGHGPQQPPHNIPGAHPGAPHFNSNMSNNQHIEKHNPVGSWQRGGWDSGIQSGKHLLLIQITEP